MDEKRVEEVERDGVIYQWFGWHHNRPAIALGLSGWDHWLIGLWRAQTDRGIAETKVVVESNDDETVKMERKEAAFNAIRDLVAPSVSRTP